jgi:hypothetical protein
MAVNKATAGEVQAGASTPIGVFDSGVGGLTVVRALMERLPFEEILYFGDTARVPYGVKSAETITGYARQITEFLLRRNVKLLIIACNTMAAVAYELSRSSRKWRDPRSGSSIPPRRWPPSQQISLPKSAWKILGGGCPTITSS